MKKVLNILIASILCFTLTACVEGKIENEVPQNNNKETMMIEYSHLSEETKSILEAVNGNNVAFYDVNVDETVKSYIINLWVYKDHEWKEAGKVGDAVDKNHYRIGINIMDKKCEIIIMDDQGHTKASYEVEELQFKNSQGSITHQIENPADIKMNQEMTLWSKVGTDENKIEATGDFRKTKCTDGFAVTITFYDKVVEL